MENDTNKNIQNDYENIESNKLTKSEVAEKISYEDIVRILILGNSCVGKTNILLNFMDKTFVESYITTVGIDFKTKNLTLPSKKIVKLQIWDTAGQERYLAVNKNLFLKVQGMLLVYDITNRDSFNDISKWMDNIKEICSEDIPILLVGNKIDLEDNRVISTDEGLKMAEKFGLKFIETSAKEGTNIEDAFITIAEYVLEKGIGNKKDGDKDGDEVIIVEMKRKKKCC